MLRALEISRGSALLILRVLHPFRMFVLRVLLAVLGVVYCSSYSQYSQYFVLLIILPVLAVFWPSVLVLLILPVLAVLGHHTLECNTLSTSSIPSIEPRNTAAQPASEKKHRTSYIRTHCTMQHDSPTPTYGSSNISIWSTAVVLLLFV